MIARGVEGIVAGNDRGFYNLSTMTHPLKTGFSFRTRLAMRIPIALAVGFWCLMLMLVVSLAVFGEHFMPATAYLGILFFLYLFGFVSIYYFSISLTVDTGGITIIGPGSFRWVPWRDILSVSVLNPYFPGYEVTTRGEAFGFSGMVFSEHQRLYELIVAYSKHGDRS